MPVNQGNDVRTRGLIANHYAIVNFLRIVNLLWHSIFSTAGSFGLRSSTLESASAGDWRNLVQSSAWHSLPCGHMSMWPAVQTPQRATRFKRIRTRSTTTSDRNLRFRGVFSAGFSVKSQGRTNRVFGKPCFCPLPKRGHFDENGENDEFAFYPLKTRVWLLRPPKTTKMAGVTQEKAWFRKGRVCSSLKKTFLGRVRVKFAQDESRERATKKPQKAPTAAQTLFCQADEGHEKVRSKNVTNNEKSSD